MSEDLAKKQQYLYKEIIEGGYNPEEFQHYMQSKNKGQDLDNWQYGSLKKLVREFKQVQDTVQQQKIDPTQTQSPLKIPTGSSPQINLSNQPETYQKIVACQLVIANKLTECKDINVQITKFDKKQGGIFEQAYAVYIIQTPCIKGLVQRRYSDFEWLRSTLQILHPGVPIPILPRKGQFRRVDEKHLKKRMFLLEMYLNKLLQIQEVKYDEITYIFLKSTDRQDLQQLKNKYKKTKSIPIDKLKKLNGQIKLQISPKLTDFMNASMKYCAQTEPQIKKIYKQFKFAATMLQNISQTMNNISAICKDLKQKQQIFCNNVNIKYETNNLFSLFQTNASRYSVLLNQQAQSFRKQIYANVKYQRLYMVGIQQSLAKLKSLADDYEQAKASLRRKKQKGSDMPKWMQKLSKKNTEQDIVKQNADIFKKQQKYALYNQQMFVEINRHFSFKNKRLSKKILKLIQIHSKVSNQFVTLWDQTYLVARQMQHPKHNQVVIVAEQ